MLYHGLNDQSNYFLGTTDDDEIYGGNQSDQLYGESGNDVIYGLDGNDIIYGGLGNDYVDGGAGLVDTVSFANALNGIVVDLGITTAQDTHEGLDMIVNIEGVLGSLYDDMIIGDINANLIAGLDGNDTIFGKGGNDTIQSGMGDDYCDGGDGRDLISFYTASNGISVNLGITTIQDTHEGLDTIINIEGVIGSRYDDTILGNNQDNFFLGNDGNDIIRGRGGNDTITGGEGDDYIDGGLGIDAVSFYASSTGVVVDLGLTTAQDTHEGKDTIINVEGVLGSLHDDTLTGNDVRNFLTGLAGNDAIYAKGGNDRLNGMAGNDKLFGGLGNDFITGGLGRDFLVGGLGNDILSGGAGKDSFVFNTAPNSVNNCDTITDFNSTDDTIRLDNAVFKQLTSATFDATTHVLSTNNFVANSSGTAQDSDDFIVYETDTGKLYYDADGNGSGAAVQIALLGTTSHPTLSSTDFLVI